MKKTVRGSVITSGYKHAIEHLKQDSPDIARVLDASPPALVEVGDQPAPDITPAPTPAGSPLLSLVPQRGRVFRPPELELPAFRKALEKVYRGQGLDPFDQTTSLSFGVKNFNEFVEITKRALTIDPGHAVTPVKAIGNYFEMVGWDHPTILALRSKIMADYINLVHSTISQSNEFRDGFYEPVKLKSPFVGPVYTMENTRVVDAVAGTVLGGGQWVDRIDYVVNNHEQVLGVFGELKPAASAKHLKGQVTTRDPRLLSALALPGADAVIEGRVGGQSTKLSMKRLVFPSNVDASALNRVAVRASITTNTRYDMKIDKDEHGDPYVRMTLYCRTDILGRIYRTLYREMGW